MDINQELFKSLDFMFHDFCTYDVDNVEFWHSRDKTGNEVEVSLEVLRKDSDLMIVLIKTKEAAQMMTDIGCDMFVYESTYRVGIDVNDCKAYRLVLLKAEFDWSKLEVVLPDNISNTELDLNQNELLTKLQEYQNCFASDVSFLHDGLRVDPYMYQ